jgi:hypothetical protein
VHNSTPQHRNATTTLVRGLYVSLTFLPLSLSLAPEWVPTS